MRLTAITLIGLLLAACGQSAPFAQVGSLHKPAVQVGPESGPAAFVAPGAVNLTVPITATIPVSASMAIAPGAVVVKPTLKVEKGAINLQLGPTTQPLVSIVNPVTVNVPSFTVPAALVSGAILIAVIAGLWLHARVTDRLAVKRAVRERLMKS